MEDGGCSCIRVMMGKKAASVFPEAVEADSSTLASELKMAARRGLDGAQRLPPFLIDVALDSGRIAGEDVHGACVTG